MILFVILAPILGAGFIAFLSGGVSLRARCATFVAITGITFLASIKVLLDFIGLNAEYGVLKSRLLGHIFALDNLAVTMVVLSTFLCFVCALCSVCDAARCYKDDNAANKCFALLLLLEAFIVGFFSTQNAVIFYVFFESSLIPMFMIIGTWGYGERIKAAYTFLIYTAAVSLLFLATLVYGSIFHAGPFSSFYEFSASYDVLSHNFRVAMWVACFLVFAVKLPIVPFHTWLPKAHVQAPTVGSMLLAGLLIKMGGYGFIRFCIGAFPDISLTFSKFILYVSAISLVYSSLVAYAQKNMKALIAYSSVAHMSYVVAGIFSFNESGVIGAIFQMVSHGLISAALFLCVGMIYARTGTLEMSKCGGLAATMPRLSSMVIFFSMASVGLPGTSGFVGEFLSILGIFQHGFVVCFFVAGTVLGAAYMLRFCREVIWGVKAEGSCYKISNDIGMWEFTILMVLAAFVVLLGVLPSPLIEFLKPWARAVVPLL